MNLHTISIIILDVVVSQVICVAIEHGLHQRYNRDIFGVAVSPDKVMKLLRKGNPEHNIPILDPYNVEKFKVNINEKNLIIDGELKNITVRGLSNDVTVDTKLNLWKRKITLTLTFPEIISTGKYIFKTIQIGDINQSASGDYQAIVRNIIVMAFVEYSLFLTNAHVEKLTVKNIDKIKISANEIKNNERLKINIYRSQMTIESALTFCSKVHITNLFERIFPDILNKILEGKSLMEIKELLT